MNLPKLPPLAWGVVVALSLATLQLLVGKPAAHPGEAVSREQSTETLPEAPCPAGTLPDDDVCVPVPASAEVPTSQTDHEQPHP